MTSHRSVRRATKRRPYRAESHLHSELLEGRVVMTASVGFDARQAVLSIMGSDANDVAEEVCKGLHVVTPFTTSAITVAAVLSTPTLAGASTLAYTEKQAATPINTVITVADADSPTLASATVQITNFVAGQDVLGFVPDAATMGNIAGSFNATTGVMTLTSAGKTATLSQFQAALRTVTYANTSFKPTTTTRGVAYQVNDGSLANNLSNIVTSAITISQATLDGTYTGAFYGAEADVPVGANTILATVSGQNVTVSLPGIGGNGTGTLINGNFNATSSGTVQSYGVTVTFTGTLVVDANNNATGSGTWSITAFGMSGTWSITRQSTHSSSPVIDLNGDLIADTIWRNAATGDNVGLIYDANGAVVSSRVLGGNKTWAIEAVGDFNGDGVTDLIWRDAVGSTVIWIMQAGGAAASAAFIGGNAIWRLEATGDYNNDRKTDIIWRNSDGGIDIMWLMSGTAPTTQAVIGGSSDWRLEATAANYDSDGDGNTDLIWASTAGAKVLQRMSGSTVLSATVLSTNANLVLAGTGDFNGDRKHDLLWRRKTTGATVGWQMDDGSVVSTAPLGGDLSWAVVSTADFDGDGKTDIIWQDKTGGTLARIMDSFTVKKTVSLGGNAIWTLIRGPGARAV